MDQKTEDQVLALLVEHTSIPDIMAATGSTRPDIVAVRDQARSEGVECDCGKELSHRGCCRGNQNAKPRPRAPRAKPPRGVGVEVTGADDFLESLQEAETAITTQIAGLQRQLEAINQVLAGVRELQELV